MTTISVIIPIRNEKINLEVSLQCLCKQVIEFTYEIIYIDSESEDGSTSLIKNKANQFSNIKLIEIKAKEFHHAKTRNFAVTQAKGQFLVFLAGDAWIKSEKWLNNLTAPVIMGQQSKIAASYGKQSPKPDADIGNIVRMSANYGKVSFIKNKEAQLTPKERYFFSTANCCINRHFVGTPLFDERFPVNEDMTLSRNIISGGYQILYIPEAEVIHSHNYTKKEIFQRYFDNGVTYKKLGIFNENNSSLKKDGLKQIKEAYLLLKRRSIKDKISYLQFFIFAALGVELGKNYNLLPKFISRCFSKYGTCE